MKNGLLTGFVLMGVLIALPAKSEECVQWDAETYYQVGDKVLYEGVGYEATEFIWWWPPTDERYWQSADCGAFDPAASRGNMGIRFFKSTGSDYLPSFQDDLMNEGSGAITFLEGDVNGDEKSDIVQLWRNDGRLAMIVYRSNGNGYDRVWGNSDMGEGAGAIEFLTGDVNDDGKMDIIQLWDNNDTRGSLAIIVYTSNGTGYERTWGDADMGEGAGAIEFLTGDVNDDGKTDLIQLWDNNERGTLAMIVYLSNGTGFDRVWGDSDMEEGAGAIDYLPGDVDGDGKTDVIQLWRNEGRLAMIVYRSNGTGFDRVWGNSNMGEGADAIRFLTGDVNEDGKTDVFQLWRNNGRLAILVYTSDGTGYVRSWGDADMGEGAGALDFLTGDMNGDGKTDILQLYKSDTTNGHLAMIAYRANGTGFDRSWGDSNLDREYLADQFMTGDVDGDGKTDVVQLFDGYNNQIGDYSTYVYRLRYNKSGWGWGNLSDTVLGTGGSHLRDIDKSNRRDVHLAFPNGHVDNPETIVLLTSGQQDGDGKDDTLTGQQANYKDFDDSDGKGSKNFKGNSFYGRLRSQLGTATTEYILVLDNSANWGDGDSERTHNKFTEYVNAKVGSNTKRIILGGYSRGGYMVAHMAKDLRGKIDDDIALYTVMLDPVAGNGDAFGVDTTDYKDNPIHDHWRWKKERTEVTKQIEWADRKSNTYFYNVVGGEPVFGGVHAFGSKHYEIISNYWTEIWVENGHGTLGHSFSHTAQIQDPAISWFLTHKQTRQSGFASDKAQEIPIFQGGEQFFYYSVQAGEPLWFHVDWDSGFDANMDVAILDPSGNVACEGNSNDASSESVVCDVTATGVYSVVVYLADGFYAEFDIEASVPIDRATYGQFTMPRAKLDNDSSYRMDYDIPITGNVSALNLQLTSDYDEADLNLVLKDPNGHIVSQSQSPGSNEYISIKTQMSGTYKIEVSSATSQNALYALSGLTALYQGN